MIKNSISRCYNNGTVNYPLLEIRPEKSPKRLREIPDPPKKLYVKGSLPPEEHKWLTVVGARRYTPYGKDAVESLVSGLAGYPVAIISGLALGIDALAHRAALTAGLACVAVPGSGLSPHVLHPASNRRLADDILLSGGALLSEFEPEFRPTVWSFPQRNRIMAGLSDAVLVIEAEIKSGTLITSRLASDYNRDVLTVPGSIFSSTSAGPHMLLQLGATPITNAHDLLEALGFASGESATRDYSACSKEELRIIELLREPLSRDNLLDMLDIPISQANALLSFMELKGLIKESAGEIHLK